ncbi:hypothetical protein BS50DRAFT_637229 [Corynespora cassiicola Philippines]|uniref:Uncharacterized protein n=1 Tax=Corynespora cassiicola Philippines TaxID=1448308 RepID=A0A2T2NEM4_CORCC|nr:hypothetical protein BS50DRAFT_637229 [Corynespora cassiicola Philippines]
MDTSYFAASVRWYNWDPDVLTMVVLHKSTTSCQGDAIERECTLRAATSRYPVIIDGSRSSISLNSTSTILDDDIATTAPSGGPEGRGESYLMGIGRMLQSRFASSVRILKDSSSNYSLDGVITDFSAQFLDYRAMQQNGNFTGGIYNHTRAIMFNDPMDYISNRTQEVMFRKALADVSADAIRNMQTIDPVDVVISTNVYPTFHGYGRLGREVSMSPLEVAKAFDAPLLAGVDPNLNAKALVKSVG